MSMMIWIIVGGVLLLAEMMIAPVFVIIYFGLSAWLVALLMSLGWLDSLSAQLLVFIGVAIILLLSSRTFFKRWFTGRFSDSQPSNVHDYNEVNKNAFGEVLEDFEHEIGVVEWRGARWRAKLSAKSRPVRVGDKVKIVKQDNITLTVMGEEI